MVNTVKDPLRLNIIPTCKILSYLKPWPGKYLEKSPPPSTRAQPIFTYVHHSQRFSGAVTYLMRDF